MATGVDEMTRRLLADAGIAHGMRVLDAGCGRGEVSFMLARLVGPSGYVLGVDRDAAALAAARERAAALGLSSVRFEAGDLAAPPGEEQADLAVEEVRAEAIVQTPVSRYPTAAIIRAMLPRIVQQGVATAAEVGIDSLEQRLLEERVTARATYVGELVFGAWGRTPKA